ncbi:hypothetical protein DFH06DRAFT_1172447 [Mycena polygramma]|nr:hypothetical protein DFH06DRAFT_1172447 [Mycena polygramma]
MRFTQWSHILRDDDRRRVFQAPWSRSRQCDLKDAAASDVKSSDVVCEEVYYLSKSKWLLVFHSSQRAFYSGQQWVDIMTQRKVYWQYIAAHPVRTEGPGAGWLPEAHDLALTFLKWCSFEKLTSPTAETPFPHKDSQDLASILSSLAEQPERDPGGASYEAASGRALSEVQASARSSPQSYGLLDEDEGEYASENEKRDSLDSDLLSEYSSTQPELASRERYQLRVALIAKVLVAKYSQQSSLDIQRPEPSNTFDGLFRILDFASLGAFSRYLNRLEEISAPSLTDDQWRNCFLRLVKEWEVELLVSTVLLSASSGILALQNIGGVPQTAILLSILFSFGSVTTGLYCISMYQLRAPDHGHSIDRTNTLDHPLMPKRIALILGLPMAFLVWSLGSFMVGILSYNFVGTDGSPGHIPNVAYAVVSVAAVVFFLVALAFYSLSRLWASGRDTGLLATIQNYYRNAIQHWRPLPPISLV